jgi:hypothetical protein
MASRRAVFPEGCEGTFIVFELYSINGFEVKNDPDVKESIIGVH